MVLPVKSKLFNLIERDQIMRKHLNQIELADYWKISERTLERWRRRGEGPPYLKLGGRCVYRMTDIEAYEEQVLRGETSVNRGC